MESRVPTDDESPTIQEAPRSDVHGPRILARGRRMGMRMWVEEPTVDPKEPTTHEYEIIGYVFEGTATVEANGQCIELEPGDSYCIPSGVTHLWTIKTPFKCIETTSPPVQDVASEVPIT